MRRQWVMAAVAAAAAGAQGEMIEAKATLRPPAEEQPVETPPVETTAPPAESETPWTKGWTGTVELGLNGSSGNSELLNFRAGAGTRRLTDRYDTKGDITYTYARDDGGESANRLEANLRNDWLIPDSRWMFFADAKFEYDEFTDYAVRLSGHVGTGYRFIKTEKDDLLGRVGVGAYKEFESSQDEIVPEAVLGADYTHIFSEAQSFTATADFYPQLDDWGPYRFVGKAAYQIIVDPESKLTFKVGIEDRYDSTPGEGFKRNDFAYFVMVAWSY